MDAGRIDLARCVLEMIACGVPVPVHDALQLRHWAILPEDSTLPLAEIAIKVLESSGIRNSR